MIVPVILAGGSGKRLWPLSRKLYPKQFINLVNNTSLFQDTILRLPEYCSSPIIVCNEEHRFIVAEQLRQIDIKPESIILEPVGKNTAPAITLAALYSVDKYNDSEFLVLSADHVIEDKEKFHHSISLASEIAVNGKLVTFGVLPSVPDTGYGYIEVDKKDFSTLQKIKSFKEKPDKKTAVKYLKSGNYFWNCGIFVFQSSKFLSELGKFEPQILNYCKKSIQNYHLDLDFIKINDTEFRKCPDKSIDHAIMERTTDGYVIPLDTNWSDVGSWPSLWNAKKKDQNNNVCEGDIVSSDTFDSFISSENRLVTTLGISDIVIIDTQDALLVASKKQINKIDRVYQKLNDSDRSELNIHRKVFRPWGYYDLIDKGQVYQVKRILVNPHSKLSLQKHKFRSEHWVVVKGIASVVRGDEIIQLLENQSAYIPIGVIHRLENKHNTPLEIIEIQVGTYLEEDDITRIEDEYSRN